MTEEQKRLEEGALKDRGITRNLSSDDLESNGEQTTVYISMSCCLFSIEMIVEFSTNNPAGT